MAQVLAAASALNAGSDLWVVPEIGNSRWVLRLDWYLNFQVLRSTHRPASARTAELETLLRDVEWTLPEFPARSDAPLMVSTEGRLPARWFVMVPGSDQTDAWAGKIHEVWNQLKKPAMRVFLPPRLQAGGFSDAWKRFSGFEDFAVVSDQV